jgi:Glycosyl hydrolases family 16/Carbohydrate binding module (family 6)
MLTTLILASAIHQPKWVLTFSQEFDGKTGTAPDRKIWSRDIGGGGYGNNELQSYTDGNKNAFLNGKGSLIIEARKEKTTGDDNITRDYSSARLKSNVGFTFWMLGADIGTAGWPKCGEIDIVEFLGHETTTVHGTIHGPGYSGGAGVSGITNSARPLYDDFHTYAIEWEPEQIRFYLDGVLYQTTTTNDVGTNDWVYDHPFFLILNLAVGGNWPGNPDATTTFPQQLTVDYIRAYKDENLVIDTEGIRKRTEYRKTHGPVYTWPGPFAVPGLVPIADFNLGGPEVGYHDTNPQNEGGKYRLKDGVDIGSSGRADIKQSVGWTKAGEWLAYDINVTETGRYSTEIMIASEGDGGDFHLEVDGKPITGSITVQNTGGWSNWKAILGGTVSLTKGKHVLKLKMDKEGKTGAIGNLASIRFAKG